MKYNIYKPHDGLSDLIPSLSHHTNIFRPYSMKDYWKNTEAKATY